MLRVFLYRYKRRGSALLLVLATAALMTLLLFSMAEMAVFHLQYATSADSQGSSRDLAESAVNEALAQALRDDSYGVASKPTVLLNGELPGSYGIVSFDPNESRVPNSTNSLTSTAQMRAPTGRIIPPSCIHLVGRGRVGNSVSTLEAIYYRPPFPKALSATGPIVADGSSVVGLPFGVTYPGSTTSIPPNQRAPGSLQSNSSLTGASSAVKLTRCDISGDAAAVGDVSLDSASVVGGEVRSHGAAQSVPTIDIAQLISNVQGVQNTVVLGGSVGSTSVDWFSGSNGPLTINGDLTLNNGVLWVRGDLIVTGGIKGYGMVLTTGSVEVRQGTSLNAQNMVALAAQGDVTLQGPNRANYYYQGLVYTNGNFSARQLTVLGTVVANSPDPTKGGLSLQDVTFVSQQVGMISGPMYVSSTNPKGTGWNRPQPTLGAVPLAFTLSLRPDSPYFDPLHPERRTSTANPPKWAGTYLKFDLTVMNLTSGRSQSYSNLTFNPSWKGSGQHQLCIYDREETDGSHAAWDSNIVRVKPGSAPLAGRRLTNQLDLLEQYNFLNDPQMQPMILLPSLNNLMTLSDRSRLLLWHFD